MVRRLVQQDDVGVLGEGPGQGRATDLAARKARRGLAGIEVEHGQGGFGQVVRRSAGRSVFQQGRADDGRLLRHERDPRSGGHVAFAAIRQNLSGQDPKQGRLAGAVAPDQAGAHPCVQGQVDSIEQHQRTIGQPDVLQGQNGSAHRGRDI